MWTAAVNCALYGAHAPPNFPAPKAGHPRSIARCGYPRPPAPHLPVASFWCFGVERAGHKVPICARAAALGRAPAAPVEVSIWRLAGIGSCVRTGGRARGRRPDIGTPGGGFVLRAEPEVRGERDPTPRRWGLRRRRCSAEAHTPQMNLTQKPTPTLRTSLGRGDRLSLKSGHGVMVTDAREETPRRGECRLGSEPSSLHRWMPSAGYILRAPLLLGTSSRKGGAVGRSISPRMSSLGAETTGAALCGHACGMIMSLPRRGAERASTWRSPGATPPDEACTQAVIRGHRR